MPQTTRSAFNRTQNGRLLYGRLSNYRLKPSMTGLPLGSAIGSAVPDDGAAPLTTDLTTADVATPVVALPLTGVLSALGGIAAQPVTLEWLPEGEGSTPIPTDVNSAEEYEYTDAGTYQAVLVATDAIGRVATQSVTVTATGV